MTVKPFPKPLGMETAAERSARLHVEASRAALEGLYAAVSASEDVRDAWAALAALDALPAGVREEARQMAAELSKRLMRVQAILGRAGR